MSTIVKKLDLENVRTSPSAKVFAGRLRGAKCREFFHIEALDQNPEVTVRIEVPKDTLAITTSFLLSFLGPSMRKAGTEEAFGKKYVFDCPDYIRPSIKEGVERALKPEASDAISTALSTG
jgi:hypothetical protein